jgi:HK97 family phage major capsid protein
MSYLNRPALPMAGLAKALLMGQGDIRGSLAIAQSSRALPEISSVLKSAIAVGSTADAAWAGTLSEYRSISSGFVNSLQEFSSFYKLLPSCRQVPLKTRVAVTSLAMTGSVVGEMETKPIGKLQLENSQLQPIKVSAAIVVTEEVLRFGGASGLGLLSVELRKAVSTAVDTAFLDALVNSSGIQSFASSGMSGAQFNADLVGILDNIEYGQDAKLFLIMPPKTARQVALMVGTNGGRQYPNMDVMGGSIAGITVVLSDSASDVVLVDASQCAAASDLVVLDSSQHATFQLSDSPTDGSANGVNLWQGNMRALKAEATFGFQLLRDTAATVLTGTTA